jgi:catechol 2,3-dioxygenase-like lactoylglutathione lyase family enzyme
MEYAISSLLSRFESGLLNRRELVQSLLVLVSAQASTGTSVKVASINHVSVQVSDLPRSVDFYKRVFGLVEKGSDENTKRLVSGTCHVSLRRGNPVGVIDHFAFGVEPFDPNSLRLELKRRGAEVRGEAQSVHVIDPDGVDVQISDKNDL